MLPVETSWPKEISAVEESPDAYLNTFNIIHQDERGDGWLHAKQGAYVSTVGKHADKSVSGRCAHLQNAASGAYRQIRESFFGVGELGRACRIQSEFSELPLGSGTVVLQAVAESAAAYNIKSRAAEFILKFAEADRFEDDDPVVPGFANPAQL
ncbi:hypothetical protein GCM10023264_11070 [Sphingomonas daechungensis]